MPTAPSNAAPASQPFDMEQRLHDFYLLEEHGQTDAIPPQMVKDVAALREAGHLPPPGMKEFNTWRDTINAGNMEVAPMQPKGTVGPLPIGATDPTAPDTPAPTPQKMTLAGTPASDNPPEVGTMLWDATKYRLASLAADYNALMYHWGYGTNPAHFKELMQNLTFQLPEKQYVPGVGDVPIPKPLQKAIPLHVPDAETLPDQVPQTKFQQVSDFLAPWQVTMPVMMSLGIGAQAATGRHEAGDAVEMAVGGVQTARQLVGVGRYAMQLKRGITTAMEGAKTAQQWFSELRAARQTAAEAQITESVAATGQRERIWNAIRRPSKMETPEQEVQRLTQMAEAPEPAAVGGDLLATGMQKSLRVPGIRTGIESIRSNLRHQVSQLGQYAMRLADTRGTNGAPMEFEPSNGAIAVFREAAQDLKDRTFGIMPKPKGPFAGAPGLAPVEEDQALMGKKLSPDEKALLSRFTTLGLDPAAAGDVSQFQPGKYKVSDLMRLYRDARKAVRDKGLYPTFAGDASRIYEGLTMKLGDVIRGEIAHDEDVAKAWRGVTDYVRDVKAPVEKTLKYISKSGTSLEALKKTYDDPQRLYDLLRATGPRWGNRLRQGIIADLIFHSGGDMAQLDKNLSEMRPHTLMMLFSQATPRSAAALSRVLTESNMVPQAKGFHDYAMALKDAEADLQPGVDAVRGAIRAAASNVHSLKPMATSMGRYHFVRGAMSAIAGHEVGAAYQLSAWALMSRPGLIKALIGVSPQSVRFGQIAGALNGLLQPYAQKSLDTTIPPSTIPIHEPSIDDQ